MKQLTLLFILGFVHALNAAAIFEFPDLTRRLPERTTTPGCAYKGGRYVHGEQVETTEPCLNCTCIRAIVVCYLRVCPSPSAPPPGCFLAREVGQCCPSLVCGGDDKSKPSKPDSDLRPTFQPELPKEETTTKTTTEAIPTTTVGVEENSLMFVSSTKPDDDDVPLLNDIPGGCLVNGTLYGDGSAMLSGSFCEYCFCIRGKTTCLKPKCDLVIEGCAPQYDSQFSCCPSKYHCNQKIAPTDFTEGVGSLPYLTDSSTTTMPGLTQFSDDYGTCILDGIVYRQGEVVPDYRKCQNCFCSEGSIICDKIKCSPALAGCLPIIPEDHCCPVSYKCDYHKDHGNYNTKATKSNSSNSEIDIKRTDVKTIKQSEFFKNNHAPNLEARPKTPGLVDESTSFYHNFVPVHRRLDEDIAELYHSPNEDIDTDFNPSENSTNFQINIGQSATPHLRENDKTLNLEVVQPMEETSNVQTEDYMKNKNNGFDLFNSTDSVSIGPPEVQTISIQELFEQLFGNNKTNNLKHPTKNVTESKRNNSKQPSSEVDSQNREKTPYNTAVTEKTPSTTIVTKRTPSSEEVTEETASSAVITEKAPSGTAVSEKIPSTTAGTEENPSTTVVTEKTPSSPAEKIPSTTVVTEKNPFSTEVTEKIPFSTEVTEKIPFSIEVTEKIPFSTEITEKIPYSVVETEKIPYSATVTEKTPYSVIVAEKTPYSTVIIENTPSTAVITEKTPSNSEVSEETPSSTVVIEKTPFNTVVKEKTPYSTVVTEKTPSGIKVTEKNPSYTVVATSIKSDYNYAYVSSETALAISDSQQDPHDSNEKNKTIKTTPPSSSTKYQYQSTTPISLNLSSDKKTTGSVALVTARTNKNSDSTMVHTTLYFSEDEIISHNEYSPYIITGSKNNRIYKKTKATSNTPIWYATESYSKTDISSNDTQLGDTNLTQNIKTSNRINSKLPTDYSKTTGDDSVSNSTYPLVEESLVNLYLPSEGRNGDSNDFTNVGAIHLGAPLSVEATELRRDPANLRNKITESGGVIFMDPKYTDINPNLQTDNIAQSTRISQIQSISSISTKSSTTPIERMDTNYVHYDRKKGPRIQDVYNQTNPGQDYKIIPFVAEDAIRGKFGKGNNTFHVIPESTQSVPDMVSDFCFIKGRIFMNGEMIPKVDPCELCRCFYGQELCQLQRCPTPPPNCIPEKLPAFCCPRFTCGNNSSFKEQSPPAQKITTTNTQGNSQFIRPIINHRIVEKPELTSLKPEEIKFGTRVRLHPTQSSKLAQTPKQEIVPATEHSTTVIPVAEPAKTTGIQSFENKRVTTSKLLELVKIPTTKVIQQDRFRVTTTKQPDIEKTTKKVPISPFSDPWGLLKVSGCNIYGKFFNINDQVEILSGPCSHCICTANGVECNDIC